MKRALYTVRGVALALFAGAALAACSSGGSSSSSSSAAPAQTGPSFDGAPLTVAQRIAQRPQRKNPSQLAGWHSMSKDAQSFSPLSAGEHGVPEFTLTGTGAPIAKEVFSPVLHVKPGQTYTFSAWVDASNVVEGKTLLWVSSASLMQMYAAASIPPNQSGRFSLTFTIPSDVSQVHFGYYTNGCVIPKGKKITVSQPLVVAQRK